MILIISNPLDPHAFLVDKKIKEMGKSSQIFDLDTLCQGGSLNHEIGSTTNHIIKTIEGVPIQMNDVTSIWLRRPHYPRLNEIVSDMKDRSFARREWVNAIDGMFQSLNVRFVNSPISQNESSKPKQLEIAQHCGLRIPHTLITNDPLQVNEFCKHHENVIHKAMTAPNNRFLDTRLFKENNRKDLTDLPIAPTIFQECISGKYDVRATVVGEDIYAARFSTSKSIAAIDSRLDFDARYEKHQIPTKVQESILQTMKRLGLVFGTVDLKIMDSGEYVFFEINPQGQFLYVEILTGLPITNAVAHFLCCE